MFFVMLQQYLPFTVLKLHYLHVLIADTIFIVATVLTVYGIETLSKQNACL